MEVKIEMDWKNIEPDIPGIILLSHGAAATGALDSVRLIYSEQRNLGAMALEMGDDPGEFYHEIEKVYRMFQGNCVFFVDFNGGTPCNQLRMFSIKNGIRISGVLGFSIPMILSAIDSRRDGFNAEEIAQRAILEGHEGIQELCAKMQCDEED